MRGNIPRWLVSAVALSWTFSTVATAGERQTQPAQKAYVDDYVAAPDSKASQSAPASDAEVIAADECCGRARRCCHVFGVHDCVACQMYPHYPYFPCAHGYYYFRPYNVSSIRPQQAIAAGWGIDPRNPYGNEIFEKIYAQYHADHAKDAPPKPTPAPAKK